MLSRLFKRQQKQAIKLPETVQRIMLQEGDVIVLCHPGSLSKEALDRVTSIGEKAFNGHKVLILEEGMKFNLSWEISPALSPLKVN